MDNISKMNEMRSKVTELVDWNFGTVPRCTSFDHLLEQLHEVELEVKNEHPITWAEYSNKYY